MTEWFVSLYGYEKVLLILWIGLCISEFGTIKISHYNNTEAEND